jgi:hypothetical protein
MPPVRKVNAYGLDDRVSIPGRGMQFCLFQRIQNGSKKLFWISFHVMKRLEYEADQSLQSRQGQEYVEIYV